MDVFVGTICAFPYNFAPLDWADCLGQTAPIQQYQALFAVIYNQYGGDGKTNFNLPNLQGRMAVHSVANAPSSSPYYFAKSGGSESFTLNAATMPAHTHTVGVTLACNNTAANSGTPVSNYPAVSPGFGSGRPGKTYVSTLPTPATTMASQISVSLGAAGVQAPASVDCRMPYLTVRYCIALYGEFPLRD